MKTIITFIMLMLSTVSFGQNNNEKLLLQIKDSVEYYSIKYITVCKEKDYYNSKDVNNFMKQFKDKDVIEIAKKFSYFEDLADKNSKSTDGSRNIYYEIKDLIHNAVCINCNTRNKDKCWKYNK